MDISGIKQPFLDNLTEDDWRIVVLRYAAWVNLLIVTVYAVALALLPTSLMASLPTIFVSIVVSVVMLIALRRGKLEIALWSCVILTTVRSNLTMVNLGDIASPFVVVGLGLTAVLIGIVGRPRHAIVYVLIVVISTFVITFLYGQGILILQVVPTSADVMMVSASYLIAMIPTTFLAWVIDDTIHSFAATKCQLETEVERRKTAEFALQTQNTWFRNVIDNTLDIFFVYDENGILIDINQNGCETLGYTREEVLGLSIAELDADWNPERMAQQTVMMSPGTIALIQGRNRRKDGSEFPVEVSVAVLKDGDKIRRIGFARDISERLANEQAVRFGEEKFRSIYNSTQVGMYIVDTNRALVDINDRWLEIIGYEREEMLGRQSVEFLTPESYKQAIEVDFPRLFKQGYSKNMSYQMVKKSGEIFDVLLSATMRYDVDGDFTGILASVLDVTEHNRMQASITENETKFRAIFNNAPTPSYLTDGRFKITAVNAAFIEMLDYEPAQVLGRRTIDFLYPEQEAWIMKEIIPRFVQEGFVNGVEVKAVHREGHLIDLLLSASAEYDVNGDVNGAIVTLTDVTQLNRMQQAISESEKRFRTLYNLSPIMMHTVDATGTITNVNDYWLSLMGYERDDVVGHPAEKFFTAESMKRAIEVDVPVFFPVGYVADLPYQMVKQNGDIIDVSFSARNQYDPDGNFTHTLATLKDVTALKRAEQRIIQSERKFKALFDDSSDFTAVLSHEGKVLDVNDRMMMVSPIGRERIIGRHIWDVFAHPEIHQNLKAMLYEIHQGATNARRELSLELQTIGKLVVDVIMTPIPSNDGDIDMMIVEARDITRLAQTREQLRQAAEDQGVLLREVHHRVKNNLQVITSMLRLQERSNATPEMLDSFRDIRNRVHSMSLIHEQLYQRTSNLDEIDLDVYMHDLMKEVARTYQRDVQVLVDVSNVRLDIDLALTCGLIVNEIVTNAMKHAFPDGRRGKIEVRGYRANGHVMLSVADDGIGLPETLTFPDAGSTGFQLIQLMSQQLAAELTIRRDSGTQFDIKFPYTAT